jgi:uncharacterized protein YndB with AHSA1/START domain
MNEFQGEASLTTESDPDAVFELITDIDRLPEWNAAIESVVERPPTLSTGSEWTVRMHPRRMPSWGSVSQAVVLDRAARRFSYETRNADGNPSSVSWSWAVEPAAGGGSTVTVRWSCTLRTLDRRVFAGPMRKRQLAREVPSSLEALAKALANTTPH